MAQEKNGVWRTICGRKIFIVEGQSLTDAMRASGKFGKSDIDATSKKQSEKKIPTKKIVKVDMDAEVQKQLATAKTPKERQKIAYRYIMDNLCGEYATLDGRAVTISSVGADKITHKDINVKLKVSPHLADFIRAGEFQGIKDVMHKKFIKFAYYKVTFQIGKEKYSALLNIGVRADGTSALYDINPFNKQ